MKLSDHTHRFRVDRCIGLLLTMKVASNPARSASPYLFPPTCLNALSR